MEINEINEIYAHYTDAKQNSLFRKWMCIAETARVQGIQKHLNTLQPFNEIYIRYTDAKQNSFFLENGGTISKLGNYKGTQKSTVKNQF